MKKKEKQAIQKWFSKSVGCVEYIDCTSAEG